MRTKQKHNNQKQTWTVIETNTNEQNEETETTYQQIFSC